LDDQRKEEWEPKIAIGIASTTQYLDGKGYLLGALCPVLFPTLGLLEIPFFFFLGNLREGGRNSTRNGITFTALFSVEFTGAQVKKIEIKCFTTPDAC